MARSSSLASRVLAFCLPLCLVDCARTPTEAELGKGGAPPGSASATNVAPVGTRGWELGREYPYRFELGTSVAFGNQQSFLDFDLRGDLLVIPTSVAKNQTTLFIAVRNGKLVSKAPDPGDQLQKVAEQASATGCLFTLVDGAVSEMRIAPDLSPLTVGIYRELGSRLQFIGSPNGSPKYEAAEHDGTGRYTAEYSRNDDKGLRYSKKKLHYSGILKAQEPATPLALGKIVPHVSVSEGDVSLSPDGRPLQVNARDEVTIAGAQNPVRSKTKVLLAAGPSVPGKPHDFTSMTERMIRIAADEVFGGKAPVSAVDSARIHGLTFDEVIRQLTELNRENPELLGGPAPADPKGRAKSHAVLRQASSLFMALAAIFRQQPETIARAEKLLRMNPILADTLIDALGSSGSSNAHVVLGELARNRNVGDKVRRRALTALVRTSTPSAASIAALERLLSDEPFHRSALYGLGTYARRLRESGDMAQAGRLAKLLQERLQRAGDQQPRIELVLGAILNCGCDEVLPQVVPLLSNQTESVRVKAVRSLQSMRDPRVDGLIAERMVNDASSEVKIAALEAARMREPAETIVRTLNAVTTADADPRVRYKGVELLIEWLPKRADLRANLQSIAVRDPQPEVRSRAQAAL